MCWTQTALLDSSIDHPPLRIPSWVVDNFLDEMDDLAKDKTHKEINSYYFMGALIWDIILQILYRDAMLAIVSLVFVFIWLLINTCSWFLATVGILVSSNFTGASALSTRLV